MAVGTKNSVIQGCGAHHIAVQTRDWDASLSFYSDVLGMEIISVCDETEINREEPLLLGHIAFFLFSL
jgi:catechol 2,3-dioxygenase-like lactoylglutathione lyase family enzyme